MVSFKYIHTEVMCCILGPARYIYVYSKPHTTKIRNFYLESTRRRWPIQLVQPTGIECPICLRFSVSVSIWSEITLSSIFMKISQMQKSTCSVYMLGVHILSLMLSLHSRCLHARLGYMLSVRAHSTC